MGIQLSQVLVTEVQKHLLPMVAAKLDSLKAQIQADVGQKISISDVVIKENIANICKSKVSFEIAKSINSYQGHIFIYIFGEFIIRCLGSIGRIWKCCFKWCSFGPTKNLC